MLITLYEYHLKKRNHSTEEREKLITIALYFLSYVEQEKAKIQQIDNKMIKNYFVSVMNQVLDIPTQKEDINVFLLFLKEKIRIKCDESDIEGIR